MNSSPHFRFVSLPFFAGLLLAFVPPLATSQIPAFSEPRIRIEFSNPVLSPSHWILEMHTDGSAHFHSDSRTFDPNKDDPSILAMPAIDKDLHLTQDFVQTFFTTAHERHLFNIPCEARNKVAFQGTKKITYTGPEGTGSCQFNFSTDKHIEELGDSAVAVAASVTEGFKLQSLQIHDRLGLDREMEYVVEAVKDGRMQQIGVIHDELENLASDESLLERVRHRARIILTKLALNGPNDQTSLDGNQ